MPSDAPTPPKITASGTRRSVEIDTLRGFACLLLVAYHLVGSGATTGLRLDESHGLAVVNNALVYLRMPLFSFLSGYVYAWRPYRQDPLHFIKGKARRLLVPMLIVGTLFAILQTVTPGTNAGAYDWSMLHIIPVSHYWFLESLFVIFIVIVALEHFGAMATEPRFIVTLSAAVALHVAEPLPVHFGLLGAVYLLPFVLLGIGCQRFGKRYSARQQLGAGLALLVVAALYAMLVMQAMPSRSSAVAVAIGAGACMALLNLRLGWRWLAWIGNYSFAIYLFHSVFTAMSRIVLQKIGIHALMLLVPIGMLAGIALPIATHFALRRLNPLGSWVLGESKARA